MPHTDWVMKLLGISDIHISALVHWNNCDGRRANLGAYTVIEVNSNQLDARPIRFESPDTQTAGETAIVCAGE